MEEGLRGALLVYTSSYLPFAQHYEPGMSIVARATSDPAPLPDLLRRALQRSDPDLALTDTGTGLVVTRAENFVLRVGAIGSALLGGLALLLAMAGLYGVISDLVLRRTHEIGVRLTLGATEARVLRMVLIEGLRPVLTGTALAAVIVGLSYLASARLFRFLGLPPQPFVLALVPVLFVAAALLASYLPARRAARVDPNVALKSL